MVGRKTGGRTAGTPNRKTQEVAELLESLNCNPIEGMVQIAQSPETGMELRGKMYAELARYRYPHLKAVEHSNPDGNVLKIVVTGIRPTEQNTA